MITHNQIKYAHVALIDNVPPTKDGSYNYLITDLLLSRKDDMAICLFSEASYEKNKTEKLNIHFIKNKKSRFYSNLYELFLKKIISPWKKYNHPNFRNFIFEANKIIKTNNISHLIVWGDPNVLSYIRSSNPNITITFAQRHFEYHTQTNPYELANYILMQNYGQYKLALEKYLQIPTPVYIIPNGAEIDYFKPIDLIEKKTLRANYGFKPDDFVIIFPSKLAPHKGAFILPALIKQLNILDPSFKLLIIGTKHPKYNRGKYVQDYNLIESDLKTSQNIVWISEGLKRKDMLTMYNISDVAIFPNLWKEGFSMSATESICCGLPILASNAGCFSEIVKNDYNGYLLDQTDLLRELLKRLTFLKNNPDLLNNMKANSREYGVKFLSREKVLKNFNYFLSENFDSINSDL
jgi:glycosyltransferase involved in cell wall biosynthesis